MLTHWKRALFAVSLVLGLLLVRASARAGEDTDRFNGSWKADFLYYTQTITFVSVHDGKSYKNYMLTPQGSAFIGDGTFSAADGKYTTSADKPNDSGVYKFIDKNSVLCTNSAGQSLLWQRDNAPLPPAVGGAAGSNQLPVGTNLAQVKTTQAIEIARNVGAAWQHDAILVNVRVFNCNNDGTTNLLANLTAFTMVFYSPSQKTGISVVSNGPAGTFYPVPLNGALKGILRAIPPGAVDLATAFANVRLFGFQGQMSQAGLSFEGETGKPVRLVWEIQSGEAYPRVVSGATGAILSPFTVLDDKVADYNKLAADTAAAVARWKAGQRRRPGMQSNAGEFTSSGLHFWEGGEGSSGENGQHNGDSASQTEEDTWDNEVGAQNAWDNGDYQAEGDFNAGEATPVEIETYGGSSE